MVWKAFVANGISRIDFQSDQRFISGLIESRDDFSPSWSSPAECGEKLSVRVIQRHENAFKGFPDGCFMKLKPGEHKPCQRSQSRKRKIKNQSCFVVITNGIELK